MQVANKLFIFSLNILVFFSFAPSLFGDSADELRDEFRGAPFERQIEIIDQIVAWEKDYLQFLDFNPSPQVLTNQGDGANYPDPSLRSKFIRILSEATTRSDMVAAHAVECFHQLAPYSYRQQHFSRLLEAFSNTELTPSLRLVEGREMLRFIKEVSPLPFGMLNKLATALAQNNFYYPQLFRTASEIVLLSIADAKASSNPRIKLALSSTEEALESMFDGSNALDALRSSRASCHHSFE